MATAEQSTVKDNIIDESTECVSLTIPLETITETKINVDDFETSDLIRSCALKELVCTTTSSSSSSTDVLISASHIESLTQSFESSTSDLLLHTRANDSGGFTSGQTTSESCNPCLPSWAAGLKDCEMIGDCYRGYVNTETDLDVLLNVHKEHTNSCWGTRQSPSSAKPSVRLMWKSQYVPYDGVPFLNSGRRATVMECQYGPRRKGNKVKIEFNEIGQPVKRSHKPTCPARIYIKKVQKFLKYRIDPNYELQGTVGTRQAQERALGALRLAGIEHGGEDRYYVQFPLEVAHQYHEDDEIMVPPSAPLISQEQITTTTGSRLDFRVVEKINELVARGVTGIYEVKHGVIQFVETELFVSRNGEVPPRHNKTYFPTITDLQNHIHQAKIALEAGTLATLPPPETPPMVPRKGERNRKRKHSEPRRVRTPKITAIDGFASMCVQGGQLEVNGDLQTTQATLQVNSEGETISQLEGQVFVMVPASSNDLFTTSDSGITSSLSNDKTLVQMQVVTMPATASSYLGQQGDCPSLGLPGQYLSLPVNVLPVSYSNNQICHVKNETINGTLGKDISSLMPSSMSNHGIETSRHHTSHTTIAPISPRAITIYNSDISMTTNDTGNGLQHSLEKDKDTMLNTIDKNSVNELFLSESQMSKQNDMFASENQMSKPNDLFVGENQMSKQNDMFASENQMSKQNDLFASENQTSKPNDLFASENQMSCRANSDFSSANTDMNNIPCYTEESYNSSLDIIKSHAEITTTPSVVLLREGSQKV